MVGVTWIHLVQNRDFKWRVFCEHGNEPTVAQNVGNFLTSGRTSIHLYIQTLKTLQQRLRTGRTQNVVAINLHHDNAQSHVSKHSRNQKTRTDCPSHPPYSPDLAPAISISLRISRCHLYEKFWSTTRVLTKQRSGRAVQFDGPYLEQWCNTSIQLFCYVQRIMLLYS